jgi:hypothetical protein
MEGETMTHIKVEFQESDGHAALSVPLERLEALAEEVAYTGVDEWGIEDDIPRTVVLGHQCGETPINIIVRRLSAKDFHVVFLLKVESGVER